MRTLILIISVLLGNLCVIQICREFPKGTVNAKCCILDKLLTECQPEKRRESSRCDNGTSKSKILKE